MTRLRLSYAGLSYFDRTMPLETGTVAVPGVDLNFVSFMSPGDLFRRQAQHAEFDASEMSLSTFIALVARGDDRFVGLPVFISRNFRHGQVYVHRDAGIDEPAALTDRDVGIFEYQMTAGLWIRGFLQHDYGVVPSQVRWWEGGLTDPHYEERMALEPPPATQLARIPPDRTLEDMLDTAELSALVTVQPPRSFGRPGSPVRRLFPNHRDIERDYHRRTGLFPIMHLVVVRRDVYEANRWVAMTLLQAFSAAKEAGMRRLRSITGLAVGLPWLSASIDELDEVFGGDAFPYGVAANRTALEAAVQYSYEQGLSPRRVRVDELFAPEVLVDPLTI
jgi:4,5-dihydroxyphthalate decarboxylase